MRTLNRSRTTGAQLARDADFSTGRQLDNCYACGRWSQRRRLPCFGSLSEVKRRFRRTFCLRFHLIVERQIMRCVAIAALFAALSVLVFASTQSAYAADQFVLPPEVTPSLRAACEADVRRLCIKEGSTVDTVRDCVVSKFMKLGKRCQFEIAQAGLAP